MNREYDAVMKTVNKVSIIISDAQSCLNKEFLLITSRSGSLREGPSVDWSPSKSIFCDGLIFQSTAFEILVADCLTFWGHETFLKELTSVFRYEKKALVSLSVCNFFGSLFFLNYLYVILLCKIFESFGI